MNVRAFIRLGRPKFLIYSFLLYTLGVSFAVYRGHPVAVGPYLSGLLFGCCTHLMTHYCNEYFDLEADSANKAQTTWTGGSRVLVNGLLSPTVSLGAAFVLQAISLACMAGMPSGGARWTAVAILLLGWFYTAPPFRLNYRGFGELTVASVLNCLLPLLGFYLQSGRADGLLFALLLPTFIIQVVRMMVMNLADHDGDTLVGKRTLPVILGQRSAVRVYLLGHALAYGVILPIMWVHVSALVSGALLLTLPLSIWQALRIARHGYRDPRTSNSIVFWASTHVAITVVAVAIGLLFEAQRTAGIDLWGSDALAASLRFCWLAPIAFGFLLVPQIIQNAVPKDWATTVTRLRA